MRDGRLNYNPQMGGSVGFGNSPKSSALRIIAVGHASARWRGAKYAQEADHRNYELSTKRANAVLDVAKAELRARLGANFPIEYAVSEIEPRSPSGILIGSFGDGSNEARLKKSRQDNSDSDRRVELKIEKITTIYTSGRVSLPPQRISGRTDSWALGVTRLRMIAAGAAVGTIEVRLRNRLTGKAMYGTADLYGGGIGGGVAKAGKDLVKQTANTIKNNLTQALSDFIGRGEVSFSTRDVMGFGDFDGEFFRVGKASAALGIKAVIAYATFPSISHSPDTLVFQRKISVGLIDLEGWGATGVLKLHGANPGDWLEYDREDMVYGSYDRVWDDSLIVTFPTAKWRLGSQESSVRQFVATWANRL